MERFSTLRATNQNLNKACLTPVSFGQAKVLHPSSASPLPISRQRYFDCKDGSDHVEFIIRSVKNVKAKSLALLAHRTLDMVKNNDASLFL